MNLQRGYKPLKKTLSGTEQPALPVYSEQAYNNPASSIDERTEIGLILPY